MSDRVEDWEDDGHVCQECVNKDAEIERLCNIVETQEDALKEFHAEIERLTTENQRLDDLRNRNELLANDRLGEIRLLTAEVSELKQTIATLMWLEEQAQDDRYSDEFIGLRYRTALWEHCEDGYMRRGEAFKRWYTRQNTDSGKENSEKDARIDSLRACRDMLLGKGSALKDDNERLTAEVRGATGNGVIQKARQMDDKLLKAIDEVLEYAFTDRSAVVAVIPWGAIWDLKDARDSVHDGDLVVGEMAYDD